MKGKSLVIILSILTLVIMGFNVVATPAVAASTDVITESVPSALDTYNADEFDCEITADAYYVENITWETWDKLFETFDIDAKIVSEVSSLYYTVGGVSTVNLETLDIQTHWFSFISEFEPEWGVESGVLAGLLLSTLDDYSFEKYLVKTDSYNLAMRMKQTYDVQTKTANFLPGLGLFYAGEPALNASTLEYRPTTQLLSASYNAAYKQKTLEGGLIDIVDKEISETEGWAALSNISDSAAHDSLNHTWDISIANKTYFDDDNATKIVEILGAGTYNAYNEMLEDSYSRALSETGTFTAYEDDVEEEITGILPNVVDTKIAGLFFVPGAILHEFIDRVRPVIQMPVKVASSAVAAVIKFTHRAATKTTSLVSHTVNRVAGGFTKTLTTAAKTATGMLFTLPGKVMGFGFKVLGFIPKLISFALPILLFGGAGILIFFFIIKPMFLDKRKKSSNRKYK